MALAFWYKDLRELSLKRESRELYSVQVASTHSVSSLTPWHRNLVLSKMLSCHKADTTAASSDIIAR
jgi:hypothetical protein